ncbi:MAG: ABC transporter substrate-binding protein [Dehalococcoidia bacterium]|nr:ABC transporter substrate-binding protein [Dehalococcoidia bacterium]MYD28025.1 ABC transporter substrate-binding protein [Dehalococcoidia bacterium]
MAPERIVSLVPSLTELVWWLGCGDALRGRTRFCEEPAGEIEVVPTIGGTKNPDIEAISAIAPDLVIANREENRREDVEALQHAGLNVLLTDPNSVEEALAMTAELGEALGREKKAERLVGEVRAAVTEGGGERLTALFVPIWRNPLMGLAGDTYGNSVLEAAGATNVLAGRTRYPEVTLDEVQALRPEAILLPDEPYRFNEGHVPEFSGIAPTAVVDGKLLWWYGPRMPEAIRELRRIIRELAA